MSMVEQRIKVIRYWWDKAEESLEAARREFEAQSFDFVINRLYYATFYAVSAALLERQLSFKKHSGVRATFHQEFIKKGLIDEKWGKLYDQLFEDRQEGDYIAFISFDSDYVKLQLERSVEFLAQIKPFITSL